MYYYKLHQLACIFLPDADTVGFKTQGNHIVFESARWGNKQNCYFPFSQRFPYKIRKLVYKCAMRLSKLATLCPLRKAKFLGRAQFRHSATYKTIHLIISNTATLPTSL